MGVLHDDPNSGEDDSKPVIVRMDSMEIEAHAKAMTRIEILYITNVLMIRYLLKKDFGNMIPDALSHYLEDGDHNKVMYYRVSEDKKAGVQDTRVAEAVNEMLVLQGGLRRISPQNFFLIFRNTKSSKECWKSRRGLMMRGDAFRKIKRISRRTACRIPLMQP